MRAKIPQPTETQITSAIIGYLRYKGFYTQRMNSGAIRNQKNRLIRMNKAGTPDIMAFKKAPAFYVDNFGSHLFVDLLFIEVKRLGNKPTFLQIEVMKELEEHGARCLVIHSLEELEKAI